MATEWFDTFQNGTALDVWSFNAVPNSIVVSSGSNYLQAGLPVSAPNGYVFSMSIEKLIGDLSGFNLPTTTPYYGYRINIEASQLGADPGTVGIGAIFPSGLQSRYLNTPSGTLFHEETFGVPTTLGGTSITIGPETGDFIIFFYTNFNYLHIPQLRITQLDLLIEALEVPNFWTSNNLTIERGI